TAGIVQCVPNLAVAWQLLLFSGLSVASLATLRPVLMRRLGARRTAYSVFDLKGKTAVVVGRIAPPEAGRVELDGSEWKAVANQPLDPGTVVTVVGHENVTLTVQPKE
ncbi:MAG: NfeD family protein, partial [Kiritimatiellia bacterium]